MKQYHRQSLALLATIVGVACFSNLIQAQEDVSTGPDPLVKSDVKSSYMRGVTSDFTSRVATLRLLNARGAADGSITIRALLLDSAGNEFRWQSTLGAFSADVGCRAAAPVRSSASKVDERLWTAGTPSTSAVVLCDNSMMSGTVARDVVRSLRNILPDVSGRDSIGVVLFDHDLLELTPISPVVAATEKCNPDVVTAADGLNAVYSACMSGLAMLSDQHQGRVLIVVTTSDDNASVSVTTADIVRRAAELQASIYVIRVGQSSRAYPYRYLSAATGGRLYTISDDDCASVGSIVREILYASKHGLEISVPANLQSASCDDIWLKLRFEQDTTSPILFDSLLLPMKTRAYRTSPAIVATFADTTEVGLQSFYPILASMAEQLMADSTIRIELIGHVSGDVKGNSDDRAFERTEFVQGFLVAYGVKKKQIVLRSEGSRRPLYYLQLDGAQRLLNNRVEARFLVADDEPYTITLDQVATEEQAGKLADVWEQRGYKAYFEAGVANRIPVYRVKLWGYRSIAEAQKEVVALKKYKPKSSIIE
ncbi:MAG: SPOR domain-containing protein [Candidatus Kapabacteria bacterium]|nr:SPOR domain-containing protein [Candidatus Kapabacteria bacterium]